MRITSARVIVTCPGRNFVTLKIETDQGVYGIGDGTLNGRELSVVAYLEEHVVPCLIGMDPRRIEDIWQYLYKGAYWRRGPVTMRAIAAVDMALWDIKAKMAGMPLYDLLGGRSRDGIMVYGHANGSDIGETVEAVGAYIDMGYKAIRAQTGVPGVKDAYGVGRGKLYYEPADAALPSVTGWDTRKALNYVPKLFEKLRETYGFDHHLLHDGHHRYTPQEAANLGKMLEPYQLFWLEDCTPAENQEAFKLVRQHTVTPLAVGEIFNTIWDAKDLIQNQLIDYIRATVVGAGRPHPSAPDRRFRRALPDPHGLPRRNRLVAGDHGLRVALRYLGAEFRDTGIHAPHGGDRRGVPARLPLREGRTVLRRKPGSRRRHRRKAGREISLQARLSASRPAGRRHHVELVSA